MMIELTSQFWAEFYALSAPLYFMLSLLTPVLILYIAVKTFFLLRIAVDKTYKRRISATCFTFVAALLYVESHAIASSFGLSFETLIGTDNLFGAITLIGCIILIDSLISSALSYDFTRNRNVHLVNKKRVLYLSSFAITLLILSVFFLESTVYDIILIVLEIILLILTFFIFKTIFDAREKLDKTSRRYTKWLVYFLLCILIVGLLDVVIDLFNLPIFVNILLIPAAIIAFVSVYNALDLLIVTYKE